MASEIKVDTISEKTAANGVTIDSVNIKDGKIATANSIDSDAYVDGSIDTAHIADDQITLAKMAAGTDGNIITYDASGNPAAVATGSDGQVLTSAGAGQPPAFEAAAAGGKVLQVVQVYKTDVTTQAGGSNGHNVFFDISGLTITVTPTKASSKLLIDLRLVIANNENYGTAKIMANVDGGSFADIGEPGASGNMTQGWIGNHHRQSNDGTESATFSNLYLWTPTYDLGEDIIIKALWSMAAGSTVVLNRSYQSTDATNTFLAPSGITVTEIN